MDIDVISYTDAQYALLTPGQMQKIISAQKKKNALEREFAKKLAAKKAELVENGMLHSDLWESAIAEMQAEHQAELTDLREGLRTYLHFVVKPEGLGNSAYELDYSLTESERFYFVKEYYETTYADAKERFTVFQKDKIAEMYLGELYLSLYDYFYIQAYS